MFEKQERDQRLSSSEDIRDSQETLLEKAGDDDDDDNTYNQARWKNRRWCTTTRLITVIILQSVLIIVLSAAVVGLGMATTDDHKPRSFTTDFGNLGSLIPYTQKTFQNPIYPKKDLSGLEIVWEEDAPRYVGTPREELDEAWDDLLSVTTFNLSGPIAQPAHDHTYKFPDGNYVLGLEVYHALHCVNAIRMMLFPENYEFREPAAETELHRHHCIDYLRQYVQCNADLTPMYAEWLGAYRLVLKPYATHTCRDFSKIQAWIEENVVEGQTSSEPLGR